MTEDNDAVELKRIPLGETATALAMAQRCRDVGEPEEAESICLDILEANPGHQEATVLLLLARTDLLDRGLPGSVDRARQPLGQLTSEYDRAYYEGIICERQARYMLRARGHRSSFVAWDWFQYAMTYFEEAMQLSPERVEPALRFNTCVRLIRGDRHCVPGPDDREEYGLE